jgi:hypothetical protein
MGLVGLLVDVVRGGGEAGREARPARRVLAAAHLQTLAAEVDFGVVPIYGMDSAVEGDEGGVQYAIDSVTRAFLKMVREAAVAMDNPVAAREKARKKRIALARKKAAAEAAAAEAVEAARRAVMTGQPSVSITEAAPPHGGEGGDDPDAMEAETAAVEMTAAAAWELRERGVWGLGVLARLPDGRKSIRDLDGITDLLACLVHVPVEHDDNDNDSEDDEEEVEGSPSSSRMKTSTKKNGLRLMSSKKLSQLEPAERAEAEARAEEEAAAVAEHKHGVEMLTLAALLNLSTQSECQVAIAKRNGIYVLLAVLHAEGHGGDVDPRVSCGSITRADLASAILNNLRTNYRNRTSLYKAELRCKVGERLVAEREQVEEASHRASARVEVAGSKNARNLVPLAPAGSRIAKAAEAVGQTAVHEMGLGGKEKRRRTWG